MSDSRGSFFSTLPGLVTGVAGLVTAMVAAAGLAIQQGWVASGSSGDHPTTTTNASTATSDSTPVGASRREASTGAAPIFEVDPTRLSFQAVGSREATVKVRNTGDVPLDGVAPSITGDDPARFRVDEGTCNGEVDPGRTCEVQVTFDPEPGSYNAVLVLEAEGGRAEEVPLEGSAVL